jgi:hypothetical protein
MPGGEDAKAIGRPPRPPAVPSGPPPSTSSHAPPVLLYLDQNYLSGIAKGKPAFRELEPVLREAVEAGAVRVPESEVHRIESAARPDLGLLDLLRELSGGLRLPEDDAPAVGRCARSLRALLERDYPDRTPMASDDLDLVALSRALPHCDLVTCDAFMAELVRRARLDTWSGCELFTGRRPDVERLRRRLVHITAVIEH